MGKVFRYKIENEHGTALLGFKSRREAIRAIPDMRPDSHWKIIKYIPDDYELKNYEKS